VTKAQQQQQQQQQRMHKTQDCKAKAAAQEAASDGQLHVVMASIYTSHTFQHAGLVLLLLLLQGNLCWEAAQEFMLSSQSVHAPVMDPDNKKMDPL
jgi:hypothetical protein